MSEPRRIQRKRTKGWRMPANTVYVGRPSKWGNPFGFKDYQFECDHQNRNAAVRDFKFFTVNGEFAAAVKAQLKGKNLACFCPEDEPCHADVLLEIANKP